LLALPTLQTFSFAALTVAPRRTIVTKIFVVSTPMDNRRNDTDRPSRIREEPAAGLLAGKTC
jgi:hypothetical protein